MDKLDNIIWEIESNRRSDSNELPDSEKFETSSRTSDRETIKDVDFIM